ncbi:MAG: YggT family protein [Chloroflexi bacterium]|nr:YggT family protein [Chloroflexota bacterium]
MNALYYFVIFLARILNLAILARVFLSWLPIDRNSGFVHLILEITEPILGPIRRIMPSLGGLDLSPMVGLILVQVAERVLLTMLSRLG